MPTSYMQALSCIVEQIEEEAPASVLDVGIGFGKYGLLCREMLDVRFERYTPETWRAVIDGIEGFAGYRNPVHDYMYNKVHYIDMLELPADLPVYDVVLLIDVLEHVSKPEGHALLARLLRHTRKALLVSTPLVPAVQGAYLGNTLETHKSRWTIIDFHRYACNHRLVPVGEEGAQIIKLLPPLAPGPLVAQLDQIWRQPAEQSTEQMQGAAQGTEQAAAHSAGQESSTPLRVGYVLPHHEVTGGLKNLLMHIRMLHDRGHHVHVYYTGASASAHAALPAWSGLAGVAQTVVQKDRPLFAMLRGLDVVVLGFVDQLGALADDGCEVPVAMLEQGYKWLFGEDPRPHFRQFYSIIGQYYMKPAALLTLSPALQELLLGRFGRRSGLVPVAIDTDRFTPRSDRAQPTPTPHAGGAQPPVVLLVGPPQLPFKGFPTALRALERLWAAGHRFSVHWVCQIAPRIQGFSYPVQVTVQPEQEQLPDLYRQSDLLLFTSWFEGFGMPPLEAMACGIPVVATRCGGIDSFAVHQDNALLADPGDEQALATHMAALLDSPQLYAQLAARGRETALRFSIDNVAPMLESALRTIAAAGPVQHQHSR